MVLSANDVADLEVDVIGTRSQVVGRHPIAAQEREVLDIALHGEAVQ